MAKPIEVLLVGPRVAQLKPHFDVRGYRCDAFVDGSAALASLAAKVRSLVVLELNLGDCGATELVERARQLSPHAAYLLLDDPSRAGQIVKALQAGVTHYLPTPPDEERLFRDAERLIVFSRAMSGDLEEDHRRALAAAHADVDKAQGDAAEAAMQGELVQQELASAHEERDALREEVDSLKRRVDELRTQGIEVSTKVEGLEARAGAAEREATEQAERAGELEQALAEQTALAKERADALAVVEAQRAALEEEKATLEERAIDLELQLDEAHTKLAFIEEQQRQADTRVQEAEARFKRDRLRLIEEKQLATAELDELRVAKAEAERKLRQLESRLAQDVSGSS